MKKRRNGYFTLIQASNAFGGWTAIPSEKLSWNVKVIKGVGMTLLSLTSVVFPGILITKTK